MYLTYGCRAISSYPPHLYLEHTMANSSAPEGSQQAHAVAPPLWQQQFSSHSGRQFLLPASPAQTPSANPTPIAYDQPAAPQPFPQYGNGMPYGSTPPVAYVYLVTRSVRH
jgi:hypothetical protein